MYRSADARPGWAEENASRVASTTHGTEKCALQTPARCNGHVTEGYRLAGTLIHCSSSPSSFHPMFSELTDGLTPRDAVGI